MSLLLPHLVLVLGMLLVLPAAVLLLQDRRTPQSVLAWLLFFLVVPYLAIPTFLLLGVRKGRRRFPDFSGPVTAEQTLPATAQRMVGLGAPAAVAGNRLRLLERPETAHAALVALVASAAQRIDATFYALEDDAVGRDFLARLAQRARDGVVVRLLLDRIGSFHAPQAELAVLRAAGGQVRFHSPFVHLPVRRHLNLRNHRKMLIADGAQVFTGGMNVGGHYLAAEPAEDVFDDLAVWLEGPCAAGYAAVFAADWAEAGGGVTPTAQTSAPVPADGPALLQLVPSGPDVAHDTVHDALVDLIHRAGRRVWIASPYVVPTPPLAGALSAAARAGVDVCLLVPERSNQRAADLARGGFLRALAKDGCRILRVAHMLHAKAGVVDDTGWVGSANFDIRSMLINYETVLFMHDAQSVATLSAWFEARLGTAQAGVPAASLPRRLVEGVFRLGAPVL